MTHDLQGRTLPFHRAVRQFRFPVQAQPQVADCVAEMRLQRQRHHAFILTLAHELRQPLSAMFGAIQVLNGEASAPAVAKTMEVIGRQAHRMNHLVEDLIQSAQWMQGATLFQIKRIDLRSRIADALADAAEAIAARRHQIVTSDSTQPLWVDADPERIQQVLSNLLDNAIKFTEPGGQIELTARSVGHEIVLRVRDTGRGLLPHEMTRVFELFSQVRPGEGGGLGIGLNVVWQIVTLHKGRIDVRSDGPSCGSEFIVTLPSAEAQVCHP